MKKIKYIVCIVLILVIILSSNVYAKYKYIFEKTVFNLTRSNNLPSFSITYSETNLTNKDVIITITFNKKIEILNERDNWVMSEDNKTIVKTVGENENGVVKIEDLYGNRIDIPYEVSNIDKEPPQIIGVENNGIYNNDVKLRYTDNIGIKDIYVDKYGSFKISSLQDYYDTQKNYGIDINTSSIKIKVKSHPKGTIYYKYYLNEDLYEITGDTEYTYRDLTPGFSGATAKVEALDKDYNVLAVETVEVKTAYFEYMTSLKTDTYCTYIYYDIDSRISKISYAIWNDGNKLGTEKWFTNNVNSDGTFTITMNYKDYGYEKDMYKIHSYFYGADNTLYYLSAINIQRGVQYNSNDNKAIDINNLTENGNYQIIVTDLAGNITEYDITIEK